MNRAFRPVDKLQFQNQALQIPAESLRPADSTAFA